MSSSERSDANSDSTMATASSKRLVRRRMVAGRCMGLLGDTAFGAGWIIADVGAEGRR
jgi:hypothetical protein